MKAAWISGMAALLFALPALGATAPPDPCPGNDSARIEAQKAWAASGTDIAVDFVSPAREAFNLDCLAGIDGLGGFTLYGGLDGLLGMLKQRICDVANEATRAMTGHLTRSAELPYGLGGVRARGGLGISGGTRTSSTTPSRVEVSGRVAVPPGGDIKAETRIENKGTSGVSTWRESLEKLFR